jgi:hypothetical protein
VLVTASATVYAPSDQPIAEDGAIAPGSPYALSKLAQEMRTLRASIEDGLDVIVVRGRWQPPADSSVTKDITVHFNAGSLSPDAPGGVARSLRELFDDLENIIHHDVVNEAQEPPAFELRWKNDLKAEQAAIRGNTPDAADRLRALAANLSKQTGLQAQVERARTTVWHITQGN